LVIILFDCFIVLNVCLNVSSDKLQRTARRNKRQFNRSGQSEPGLFVRLRNNFYRHLFKCRSQVWRRSTHKENLMYKTKYVERQLCLMRL